MVRSAPQRFFRNVPRFEKLLPPFYRQRDASMIDERLWNDGPAWCAAEEQPRYGEPVIHKQSTH
jgi:hypothetical protein